MTSTQGKALNSTVRTISNTVSPKRLGPTVWTSGPKNAILKKTIRSPRSTSRATCPATPTLMTTAIGATSRNTDTCGIRVTLTWAGRPTASVIGIGWARGAGAGLTLNPGALLPSTTAAGIILVADGAGAQGRSTSPQFTACVRWFLWRRELWVRIRFWGRNRLVPAGIWGTLLSRLPLQPDFHQ